MPPKMNIQPLPSPPHLPLPASTLTFNSLSFCNTSNSSLSTPYCSASFLPLTTLARSAASPSSRFPLLRTGAGWDVGAGV